MTIHHLCHCGNLIPKPGRCPTCNQARGSSTARGYDQAHKRRRESLLPTAYGQPCPICGAIMQRSEALDLDHTQPLHTNRRSVGDRIVHAHCNRGRRDFLRTPQNDPARRPPLIFRGSAENSIDRACPAAANL